MNNNFIQYTRQTRNCHSVVGYGDVLRTGMGYAAEYILTVEHTCATVDNQVVSGQIFREVASGDEVYLQLFANTFPQQAGNFHLPDVLGQRSMGTGFGYQYARLRCEAVDSSSSLYKSMDIPFLTGKKNRKRSEAAFGRLLPINDGEYLRICDYQFWRASKGLQRGLQLIGGAAHH